jgi:hypothetical protein
LSSATTVTVDDHSATDAALGFYYQSLYGLLVIVKAVEDDATVCLERLDDVETPRSAEALPEQEAGGGEHRLRGSLEDTAGMDRRAAKSEH